MGKSRKRGGEKAHRKRVQNRNKTIKGYVRNQQRLFQESLMEQLQQIRNMSGDTGQDFAETTENVTLKTSDSLNQNAEIL
jgi:hypothetical protein